MGGIRDGWNSIDWNASSTWATIILGAIGSLVAAAIVAVLSRAHRAVRGSGYFALLLIVPAVWLVASAFGLMLAIHESEHSASSATLWRGASWIVFIGVASSILSVGWRKLRKVRDPGHIGPDFGRYRRKLYVAEQAGLAVLLAPVSFGLMLVALGLWHRYHSLGQVVVLGLVYIVVSAVCVNALFESGFGLYRLAMTA